ncbi:hypothetical protein KJ742_05040 [Patescibacteria group bacterium]|nr:hypothetical protein [Patescibacteria group bacterium]MBU1683284.1 hypothetical protein [Patescibacteria group bacterium]MBU1934692.1 hypothetical protein [Patescibacteria group bacterium]
MKNCKQCSQSFEITDKDREFYNKMDVPEPTWCPDCREMRRMAWCNEMMLYPNKCQLCGKRVISQLNSKDPRPVYCVDCWWSDKWTSNAYAQDLDLNRSIFDQLHELELKVPHCCVSTDISNENSEYTHHAGQERNCYMLFHATFAENCYYGYGVKKALNCVDVHYCHDSELCYECVDVKKCYKLAWSQDCTNCADSYFLQDCTDCKNCFGCVGLKNKRYYINNKPYTEEDYEKFLAQFNVNTYSGTQKLKKLATDFFLKMPKKALRMINCEDSFGDHLFNAHDAMYCFDCSDMEHSKYCSQMQLGVKYCYDIYQYGVEAELCYEGAMIGTNAYNIRFCYLCLWQVSDLTYCIDCYTSKNCFGCFGLQRSKFCILNKQYSESEYKDLEKKIIEKMKADGEWGEFLPIKYSQSAYNETTAQLWYPKTKEEVLKNGWQWQDDLPGTYGQETLKEIPDNINDVPDTIINEVIACESCKKNYKIIEQELKFYKKQGYPLPHQCFQCRRIARMDIRNRRDIYDRKCGKCTIDIKTTYSPDRPEKIYCEQCYLKEVY